MRNIGPKELEGGIQGKGRGYGVEIMVWSGCAALPGSVCEWWGGRLQRKTVSQADPKGRGVEG